MREEIIAQLNQINKDFYAKTAKYFSATRQYSWQGWDILWDYLEENEIKPKSVLDIGCGNGRFVSFLQERLDNFSYTGFDGSKELLDIAQESHNSSNIEFHHGDLLDETLYKKLPKYDLIVLFGVLHHVPGKTSRVKLFDTLKQCHSSTGVIVVSVWDFIKQERFRNKLISWDKVNVDPRDVEENDYLMSWDKGVLAYRYAHYTTEAEMQDITQKTNLSINHSYYADGKSKDLNRYFLFE